VGRSGIIVHTLNPIWDFECKLTVPEGAKKIEIQIWNFDPIKDGHMGQVVIPVADAFAGQINFLKEPSPLVTKKGKEVPQAGLFFSMKPYQTGSSPFIYPDNPGFTVVATVLTTKAESVAIISSVTVGLAGQKIKTRRRPTLSGFWIQEMHFLDVQPNSLLTVEMKQKDKLITGQYEVTSEDLYGEPKEIAVPLKSATSKNAALWIHLLCFIPFRDSSMNHEPVSPARCTVHESTLFGYLTGTKNQDSGKARWPCFEIELDKIPEVFGDERQGWNRNYSAAQTIYKAGPKSATIRTGIRSQHSAIYRKRPHDQSGNIFCGDSFFRLLHYGFRRGKPRYFTYIIADNCMRFSETGAEFSKDFMSKHAMHANCQPEVVYSGEFAILKNTEKGNLFLQIDNNSGTFAPNKAILPKLKQLMEINFPFIEVKALSYDDPEFAECRERMKALQARSGKHWNVIIRD